jgi:acetyl esterase/lipase
MAILTKQPGSVEVREDVIFGTGGGRELKCDVYLPPVDGKGRMAVLLIHGGGWRFGDKSMLKDYGVQLARYGFVCVSCEYRLSGELTWPAQIEDCKAALRWMKTNADALGLDANLIAVSGNSAGAHLSLLMGGTPNIADFEGDGGNAGVDTSVAAVVAMYGGSRLRTAGNLGAPVDMLFGRSDVDEETLAKASPITWSSSHFPPTLLIHGNKDTVVPVSGTLNMYTRLAEEGAKVEMHIYEGAPHGFDFAPEFRQQVIDIIALFIDRQLSSPRFEGFVPPAERLFPVR